MGRIDKPWGYEKQILITQVDIGDRTGMLGIRKLVINSEEMTSYSYHEEQSDIIYPEKGNITLRKDEELEKLEEGNAKIVRKGVRHQIQNIGGDVAEVLEISFPYSPEDVVRVEDPYSDQR
ncbi:MAG: cupin domain-containing protein [Candidatus Nanohaloarchaea archaeon]